VLLHEPTVRRENPGRDHFDGDDRFKVDSDVWEGSCSSNLCFAFVLWYDLIDQDSTVGSLRVPIHIERHCFSPFRGCCGRFITLATIPLLRPQGAATVLSPSRR